MSTVVVKATKSKETVSICGSQKIISRSEYINSWSQLRSKLYKALGKPEPKDSQTATNTLVKLFAERIYKQIAKTDTDDPKELKKLAVKEFNCQSLTGTKDPGSVTIVDARNFTNWTPEKFKDLKKSDWAKMWIACVRSYLLKEIRKDSVNEILLNILQDEGRVASIRGIFGYRAMATLFSNGSMLNAYKEMSALCKALNLEFKDLEWGNAYHGTSQEFRVTLKFIKDNWNTLIAADTKAEDKYKELPENLKGIFGYIAYAEAKCSGSMLKAYLQMSALCKALNLEFKDLEWGAQFNGRSQEFRDELKFLKDNWNTLIAADTKPKDKYTSLTENLKGIYGYIAYAEAKCSGSIKKAYLQMSALCKALNLEFKDLEWGAQFNGTSQEFRDTLKFIKDNWNTLIAADTKAEDKYTSLPENLKGIFGYIAYAETKCAGSMQKAYQQMSALCKALNLEFKNLEWGAAFHATSSQFRDELKFLKDNWDTLTAEDTKLEDKYKELPENLKGIFGYIAYAEAKCSGSMLKASLQMSALCKALNLEFKDLEWGAQFNGRSQEFRETKLDSFR